jgi:hypothetical protein
MRCRPGVVLDSAKECDAAAHAVLVQGVVNEEIFQTFHNKTRLEEHIGSAPEQLHEFFDSEILAPTASYFNETLAQHLSGLKPNFSEVSPSLSLLKHTDYAA